jgi:hypothetical protein
MNSLKVILLLAALGGGYQYWQHRDQVAEPSNDSGFVPVPTVKEAMPGTVMVMAAKNCSRAEAQRADKLAQDLEAKGIRVDRRDNLSFTMDGDAATNQNLTTIMNGPLPAVFIDGRAKSNPSLTEVFAELKQTLNKSVIPASGDFVARSEATRQSTKR